MAFLFFTGFYLNNRRYAWTAFAVMLTGRFVPIIGALYWSAALSEKGG